MSTIVPRTLGKSSRMAAAMQLVAELDPAMREFLDHTLAANQKSFGPTRMAWVAPTDPAAPAAPEAPEAPTGDPAKPEDAKPEEKPEGDPAAPDLTPEQIDEIAQQYEKDEAAEAEAEAKAEADKDEPLNPEGVRALTRIKAERAELKAQAETDAKSIADLKAEIETLKAAKATAPATQGDPASATAPAANSEVAEIKAMLAEDALIAAATAAGFSNPALITRLIDVPFKGLRVDREALGHALDELAGENPGLLKTKPGPKPKAKGPAGGGTHAAAGNAAAQLTFAEAAALSPEDLAKASAEGRTRDIYSGRG